MIKKKIIILILLFSNIMLSYAQTGYPIPQETSNRLFYIQRNHNKNTIVYDANFDDNGNLNLDDPINVY